MFPSMKELIVFVPSLRFSWSLPLSEKGISSSLSVRKEKVGLQEILSLLSIWIAYINPFNAEATLTRTQKSLKTF